MHEERLLSYHAQTRTLGTTIESPSRSLKLLKKTSTQKITRLRLSCNSYAIHMNTDNHKYYPIFNQSENTGTCLALIHSYFADDYITEMHCPTTASLLQAIHRFIGFHYFATFVSTAIRKFHENIEVQISLNERLFYI